MRAPPPDGAHGRRSSAPTSCTRACFSEYGDDSVAQLGGAHLACEGVSNVLTKVLEWGRLMAYLEQSTRYVPYTDRPDGRWKYHVPAELDGLAARATVRRDARRGLRDLRALDSADGGALPREVSEGAGRFRRRVPLGDSRQGARHAARAAAGGDDVERRALRHAARRTRRCCCGCSRIRSPRSAAVAQLMLDELRKVIPAFLTRVDQPTAAAAGVEYLADHARGLRRRPRDRWSMASMPEPRPRGRRSPISIRTAR